jgi:hypothetical protein
MTRYSTEAIIAQINSRLPDNNAGEITPLVLRGVLTDVVMSLRATGAYIAGTTGITGSFDNQDFKQVQGIYTLQQTRDDTEVECDLANGGFIARYASDYNIKGSYSLTGNANERVILGVAVNGVVGTYFKVEEQLDGTSTPTEVNMDAVVHLNVNDTIAIWFSSPTFPTSITIYNAAATLTLLPSRV